MRDPDRFDAWLQRTLESARVLVDSVRGAVGDNEDGIRQTVRSLQTVYQTS